MKRKLAIGFILMIAAMAFLTISCAKEVVQSQAETTSQPEAPVASEQPVETAEQTEPPAEAAPAPAGIDTAVVNERIYFGYDSAILSDQAPRILTRMADYMRTNPDLSVTVQGHCDERGTEAYNMNLGAQRAEAVKTFLVDQGIQVDRLATMSYGEARPAVMGQNETAWARNRRAEFEIN
jgi:peptidoglycan-associated lipoprotein